MIYSSQYLAGSGYGFLLVHMHKPNFICAAEELKWRIIASQIEGCIWLNFFPIFFGEGIQEKIVLFLDSTVTIGPTTEGPETK